ncbi:tyrosine-type recombinase/integrase [Candidatus Bathyarchaeota archaeon]|nr:tyrosine-type recombinase/integrase [Candidatus Bathyarchaeota archaeon]
MGAEQTSRTGKDKKQKPLSREDQIFERAMKRLKTTPDVIEEDRHCILRLVEHLLAKGVGKSRVVKYINHLIVVARIGLKINGEPIGQFNRTGIEKVVGRINTRRYTEHTKHDYKIIIKKYFQWLRGCDEDAHEYPPEVAWIKTSFKKKRLLPEALLTAEEFKKLVGATENLRDRALILSHYDGGFRIGETLSLRILNVSFDKYSAVVRVDGKTGPRRVRLTISTPALASWLSIHPFKNDPNAPLWVGVGTVGRGDPLSYDGARALLRRLAKKAGLKKRVYTHLMRHTRATELANILTEAQMKEHLGWVPGSDMPSTYVHLSGRDVDGAILKAHGITVDQETKAKVALILTKCPRCDQESSSDAQFCPKCGMVLNDKAALKLQEERNLADRIMTLLMKDSEVRKLLARKISELYESSRLDSTSQEAL